ncbi:MAG: hypothetical protein EOO27_03110 [Comamonadaceae bacterium]|nr:MAG: hypothetical protein EOO27_03110 [Comamonadaceae bacterium]
MILVGNLGRPRGTNQKNAAGPVVAPAAQTFEKATLGERKNFRPATTARTAAFSEPPRDWLADFRALVATYEKERWQGLIDDAESRKFVPVRMRLVKHYFDLYDSARLANDGRSIAIMESRLERMAFNHPRWGALL